MMSLPATLLVLLKLDGGTISLPATLLVLLIVLVTVWLLR